jgi:predicted nucleic acid-binding protein
MIAYIDSSVVLRIVLSQSNRLREWKSIERGVSSALLEVECLRTLDRLRFMASSDPVDFSARRAAVFRLLEGIELVEISPPVLRRAAQPMPGPLGTLDAIHLATAQAWRELRNVPLVIATHNHALGLAAQGDGFGVVGCAL